jgi:hypothetical protein
MTQGDAKSGRLGLTSSIRGTPYSPPEVVVMSCAARMEDTSRVVWLGVGSQTTPVIADYGDSATVVMVRSHTPLRLGDRFELDGITWIISHERTKLRGYVARPVRRW